MIFFFFFSVPNTALGVEVSLGNVSPVHPHQPQRPVCLLSSSQSFSYLLFPSLFVSVCPSAYSICIQSMLVSFMSYILDLPPTLFLFTSGFDLSSCVGGIYSCRFNLCSSEKFSFTAVLIFSVSVKNLWNSLLL